MSVAVTSFAVNAKNGARLNQHDLAKLAAGGCIAIPFTATVFGALGIASSITCSTACVPIWTRVRLVRSMWQVDVTVERDPMLRRVTVMSGELSVNRPYGSHENLPECRWRFHDALVSDGEPGKHQAAGRFGALPVKPEQPDRRSVGSA